MDMHAGQRNVSVATVRQLVDTQFPEWRDFPVTRVSAQGTVNSLFRIGDHLSARFPLTDADIDAVWREADAAAELVGRTRFPTPEPVALGEPGAGYPLPWSVQTWLPGVPADVQDPGESVEFADDLAEFITDVRALDTRGRTFAGSGRGGDLPAHDEWMRTCFERSAALLDVPRLRRLWRRLRELPRDTPDVMSHGDLIPGNVLVSGGRLAGVIDLGCFGPADPALDLIGAWTMLETGPRQAFRDHLGRGELEWERGRAWAFQQAMGLVWYYAESNPPMSRMGLRTLHRILAAD